jgi:hypothetical protein
LLLGLPLAWRPSQVEAIARQKESLI